MIATSQPCEGCAGPCLTYKGSLWGFTCHSCIRRHQEMQAARADAKDQKRRENLCLIRNPETVSLVGPTPRGGDGAPRSYTDRHHPSALVPKS